MTFSKIKISEDTRNAFLEWLIGSKGSVFRFVYKDMLKNNKEPLGKDIDEFFSVSSTIAERTSENAILKKEYIDTINLVEKGEKNDF